MKKYKLFEDSGGAFVALQILEGVAKALPDNVAERCDVRLFTNCREEGYTICVRRLKPKGEGHEGRYSHATFSEDRNSDSIVLYTGPNIDPGFGTNTMAGSLGKTQSVQDKEYKDKQFFNPTPKGHKECVAAIVVFLSSR